MSFRTSSAIALAVTLPLVAIAAVAAYAAADQTIAHQRGNPHHHTPATLHRSHTVASAQLKPETFWLGVRERNTPGPWGPISNFGRATGMQPQLVLYYSAWFEPFQETFAREAYDHHATVIVQIQPWGNLPALTAGHYDSYLRSFAAQVRDFGHPVVIGFGHEMNGIWYPWGYSHQPPSAFVAAWRHVVQVFRQSGAHNVTWLWTASCSGEKGVPLRVYWPGAKYVNWIGLDGYYYRRRELFYKVYGQAIDQVRKFTNEPILLGEVGIGQVAGQARRLPDLFAGIKSHHLLGFVWFDVDQHGSPYSQDWRLEGHPAALTAFRAGLKSITGH